MSERVVLVTGCSRGIGRAAALALAQRGWRVVATLRGEQGREVLQDAGVQVRQLDIRDNAAVQRLVQELVQEHGGLDGLVANAGYGLYGCFEDLDDEEIRQQMEVNFFGTLACARAALPQLRRRRGALVLVSSIAGRRGAPGSSMYNASKFALEGWGEALRYELQPFGVRVALVEPGYTVSGFQAARVRGARVGSGAYAAISQRLDALHRASAGGGAPVETAVRSIVLGLEDPRVPLRLLPTAKARLEVMAARMLPGAVFEGLVRWHLRFPRS